MNHHLFDFKPTSYGNGDVSVHVYSVYYLVSKITRIFENIFTGLNRATT